MLPDRPLPPAGCAALVQPEEAHPQEARRGDRQIHRPLEAGHLNGPAIRRRAEEHREQVLPDGLPMGCRPDTHPREALPGGRPVRHPPRGNRRRRGSVGRGGAQRPPARGANDGRYPNSPNPRRRRSAARSRPRSPGLVNRHNRKSPDNHNPVADRQRDIPAAGKHLDSHSHSQPDLAARRSRPMAAAVPSVRNGDASCPLPCHEICSRLPN